MNMLNQGSPSKDPGTAPILYLGDSTLDTAASYLAGVLAHHGLAFDYFASDESPTLEQLSGERKLLIISDFMAKMLTREIQDAIVEQIHGGTGLLMIGGWESFCGLGGDWAQTPIAAVLPVEIAARDDRINYDQVALLSRVTDHPILENLPWDERPPTIGGFNRFRAKEEGQVLLNVIRHRVRHAGQRFEFEAAETNPLLVVGAYGQGRTAALATDLAPHWVGPLVDWGTENQPLPSGSGRVAAQAKGAEEVEIGCFYVQFVYQLLKWMGRFD
jgi:uncharacterized membrane protein